MLSPTGGAVSGNDPKDEGQGDRAAPTDSELSARLRRLETQIDRKRPPAAPDLSPRPGSSDRSSLGQAMTLSTEFIAGVIAGGILGWLCDHFLGTKPWGMIVFVLLGFVTGVYNIMRLSGFSGAKDRPKDRKGP
ncbi:AtpZ/AtpI family protein [Methylobacterium symbioticum]|uniref:AtpZ/AtpI family protein n=1 Tax=Methylobacterium symbioticum TaxID=2584084 RepID=UPI003F666E40